MHFEDGRSCRPSPLRRFRSSVLPCACNRVHENATCTFDGARQQIKPDCIQRLAPEASRPGAPHGDDVVRLVSQRQRGTVPSHLQPCRRLSPGQRYAGRESVRSCHPHKAAQPPSTGRSTPVIWRERSEAKNKRGPRESSPVLIRLRRIVRRMMCGASSSEMPRRCAISGTTWCGSGDHRPSPGATKFTLMLCGPSSSAKLFVIPRGPTSSSNNARVPRGRACRRCRRIDDLPVLLRLHRRRDGADHVEGTAHVQGARCRRTRPGLVWAPVLPMGPEPPAMFTSTSILPPNAIASLATRSHAVLLVTSHMKP